MTTITISLSDDRLQKLKEIATRFSVAPEELVTHPEEDFKQALEYTLKKTLNFIDG